MRALFVAMISASSAAAETPMLLPNPLAVVRGDWGLELFDDMNCANNPVRIRHKSGRLIFQWPNSVEYADGTVNDDVTFAVLEVKDGDIHLKRERDGVAATIILAPDGLSFQYQEADPGSGSTFERCTDLSS